MPFVHETARLRVAPMTLADAPALYAYRADPSVTRFQGFAPESVADAEAFIEGSLGADLSEPDRWCQVGLFLRETGELVGDMGAKRFGYDGAHAEVGFTIAPGHQRRGLATEAVHALLAYLFDDLSLHRAIGSVDPANVGSRALLERLGMRQEAHFVKAYWFRDRWVDDVVYAMLREEWGALTPPSP
jgi:RimJ/RimL family protein N-acetyltransferase